MSDLVLWPQLSVNRDPETPVKLRANEFGPPVGLEWTGPAFDDTSWADGSYGVGYEDSVNGAHHLLESHVPPGTFSGMARRARRSYSPSREI